MTSQSIITTLETLTSTVTDGDLNQTASLFETLQEQYQDAQNMEAIRQKQFLVAHNQAELTSGERQTLAEYSGSVSSIQTQRAQLAVQAGRYLSVRDSEPAELGEHLEETLSAERQLINQRVTANSVEINRKLPPIVDLLSVEASPKVLPKGSTGILSVAVVNAGDQPSNDIEVVLSSESEISLESKAVNLGSITETATAEISLVATKTGRPTIEATCKNSNESLDYDLTTVPVLNKPDFVNAARQKVNNAIKQLNQSGPGDSIEAKLKNARKKLTEALNDIDRNDQTRAENSLNAAQNILEAIIDQIDGVNKKRNQSLSDPEAFYLTQDTEAAIASIKRAQRAKI